MVRNIGARLLACRRHGEHRGMPAPGGRQCDRACTALRPKSALTMMTLQHWLTCTGSPQLPHAIARAGGRQGAALNVASMSTALPARSPERQGVVLVVLDFEEDVQHHWPTAAGRSAQMLQWSGHSRRKTQHFALYSSSILFLNSMLRLQPQTTRQQHANSSTVGSWYAYLNGCWGTAGAAPVQADVASCYHSCQPRQPHGT